MNHELMMLRGLLVASLLVCGLILGNMLTYQGNPVLLAGNNSASAAPATGSVPTDGVTCPRTAS